MSILTKQECSNAPWELLSVTTWGDGDPKMAWLMMKDIRFWIQLSHSLGDWLLQCLWKIFLYHLLELDVCTPWTSAIFITIELEFSKEEIRHCSSIKCFKYADMCKNVHSSSVCNSQEVETTMMSVNSRMNKLRPGHRIKFCDFHITLKVKNYCYMQQSGWSWKAQLHERPDTRECILSESTYITKFKSLYQRWIHWCPHCSH